MVSLKSISRRDCEYHGAKDSSKIDVLEFHLWSKIQTVASYLSYKTKNNKTFLFTYLERADEVRHL